MEELPNYYSIIPASVRYDNRLKPIERLLYGEITSLSNKDGYCFATNSYFAKLYQVDAATVSRYISNLQDKGHISVEIIYKEGSKEIKERRIFIGTPIDRIINTPIDRTINTPIDRTVKDNNINNNNINNNIYSDVIDYLNKKANKSFRATSADTKKHINARIKEKYTLDDFKAVIDNQCSKWMGTEYEQYLRPSTLFGTKFENYLNSIPKKQQDKQIDKMVKEEFRVVELTEEEILEQERKKFMGR